MVFGIRMKTELRRSSLFLTKSLKAFVGEKKKKHEKGYQNFTRELKTGVRRIIQIAVLVSLSTKHSLLLSFSPPELSTGNVYITFISRSSTNPGICLNRITLKPDCTPSKLISATDDNAEHT
jgi:hypothetical protein